MIGNKNLNYITLFELIVDMRRYFIYLLTIVCFCSLHAQNYECSTIQTHRIEVTKSLDKHPDSLALEILSPYSQGVDSLIGEAIAGDGTADLEVAIAIDLRKSCLIDILFLQLVIEEDGEWGIDQ